MKKEVWKDIDDHVGYYQVSDKGRLRRVRIVGNCEMKVVKYLEPKYRPLQGQAIAILCKETVHTTVMMHRLVFDTFFPEKRADRPRIGFKDGNPANWEAKNLVINQKGSWRHTITPEQWAKIGKKDLSEKRIKRLAEKFGVSQRYVYSKLCKLRSEAAL